MKILDRFRRRRSFSRRNSPVKTNDEENRSSKNGRLILAVAGTFALMVLLVAANLKLLLSPTTPQQKPAASDLLRSEFSYPAGANSATAVPDKVCVPSPVTSDSERSEHEGRKFGRDDEITNQVGRKDTEEASSNAESTSQSLESGVKKGTSEDRKARNKKTSQNDAQLSSERADPTAKRYTVQVGAFTDPQTAQQQALHWKSRGYNAVLRPVAMQSGVVYRLYLGSFKSEKEADDLVKDLKTKGVTAFRLLVSK